MHKCDSIHGVTLLLVTLLLDSIGEKVDSIGEKVIGATGKNSVGLPSCLVKIERGSYITIIFLPIDIYFYLS